MKFKEFFGWYGAAAIVAAYALNSFQILDTDNVLYQFLNLTGSIGIVLIALEKKTYQPAALNTVWGIIALISIGVIVLT